MIPDPVACGLSTLSRKIFKRVGLLFGPQHLVMFRVGIFYGRQESESSPPPPPQHGRAWGWILAALLLTSSVTWAPSHFIPLNLFSQL